MTLRRVKELFSRISMKEICEGMRLMRKRDMEFMEIEQEQYMLILLLFNQDYEREKPSVMSLEKEFRVNLMQEISDLKLIDGREKAPEKANGTSDIAKALPVFRELTFHILTILDLKLMKVILTKDPETLRCHCEAIVKMLVSLCHPNMEVQTTPGSQKEQNQAGGTGQRFITYCHKIYFFCVFRSFMVEFDLDSIVQEKKYQKGTLSEANTQMIYCLTAFLQNFIYNDQPEHPFFPTPDAYKKANFQAVHRILNGTASSVLRDPKRLALIISTLISSRNYFTYDFGPMKGLIPLVYYHLKEVILHSKLKEKLREMSMEVLSLLMNLGDAIEPECFIRERTGTLTLANRLALSLYSFSYKYLTTLYFICSNYPSFPVKITKGFQDSLLESRVADTNSSDFNEMISGKGLEFGRMSRLEDLKEDMVVTFLDLSPRDTKLTNMIIYIFDLSEDRSEFSDHLHVGPKTAFFSFLLFLLGEQIKFNEAKGIEYTIKQLFSVVNLPGNRKGKQMQYIEESIKTAGQCVLLFESFARLEEDFLKADKEDLQATVIRHLCLSAQGIPMLIGSAENPEIVALLVELGSQIIDCLLVWIDLNPLVILNEDASSQSELAQLRDPITMRSGASHRIQNKLQACSMKLAGKLAGSIMKVIDQFILFEKNGEKVLAEASFGFVEKLLMDVIGVQQKGNSRTILNEKILDNLEKIQQVITNFVTLSTGPTEPKKTSETNETVETNETSEQTSTEGGKTSSETQKESKDIEVDEKLIETKKIQLVKELFSYCGFSGSMLARENFTSLAGRDPQSLLHYLNYQVLNTNCEYQTSPHIYFSWKDSTILGLVKGKTNLLKVLIRDRTGRYGYMIEKKFLKKDSASSSSKDGGSLLSDLDFKQTSPW